MDCRVRPGNDGGGCSRKLMRAVGPSTAHGRLRALFEAAGARWLDLPVLHPADPFLETAGEDIRKRMFVTEGPTGERLALRPDFTIPVCLHHLKTGSAPRRYAYEGVVFRRHDGGSPERLETGYEDIGRPDRTAADAEALALAIGGVASLGAGPIVAQLGDIGLFVALLRALGLPEPWRRRLRRSFGAPAVMARNLQRLSSPREGDTARLDPQLRKAALRHDEALIAAALEERFAAQGHAPGAGRSAEEIAARFLDRQALSEARIEPDALRSLAAFLDTQCSLAEAPDRLDRFAADRGLELGDAIEVFAERARAVAAIAPAAEIRFSGGFGRPLDYYTGLVFEVRAANFPYPVAGGGRYDRLLEMLGSSAPVPAVGFTIRLDEQAGGAA